MNENDDKLLKQFFTEQKQEIPNKGFTARVMRRLPNRVNKLSGILTACCTVTSVILFFMFDGLQAILSILRNLYVAIIQYGAASLDLRTLLIAGGVLLFFGLHKIYKME